MKSIFVSAIVAVASVYSLQYNMVFNSAEWWSKPTEILLILVAVISFPAVFISVVEYCTRKESNGNV